MLIRPVQYRHFKGGLYAKLLTGYLESAGMEGEEMTVYRSLENGRIWIRPSGEFFGQVETEAGKQRRFTLVSDAKEAPDAR